MNKTLLELLKESSHLLLPKNSYGYVWKIEHHKRFLDDVLNLVKDKTTQHSLGTIKLEKTENADIYTILEGSQRLICTSVFLAVISAFCEKVLENNNSPKSKIQRYFLANYDSDGIPHMKIVLNDFDAVTFKNILLDRVNYTNHASKSILNVYMFFLGQMAIHKLNPMEVFEAISRLEVEVNIVSEVGLLQTFTKQEDLAKTA